MATEVEPCIIITRARWRYVCRGGKVRNGAKRHILHLVVLAKVASMPAMNSQVQSTCKTEVS